MGERENNKKSPESDLKDAPLLPESEIMVGRGAVLHGIDIINADHHIEYASRPMLRRYGELDGKTCYEVYMNRVEPCENCPAMQAMKTMKPVKIEFAGKTGRHYVISAAPVRNKDGSVSAIETIVDVTERVRQDTQRKRSEEALLASEKRFRDLVETTPDLIWEVDGEAGYTYVSPNIEEILGYRSDEVIGKTPFDLMPEEEGGKAARLFSEKAAAREAIRGLERITLHKDGRTLALETSGVPVFDERGDLKGYRGIDRDITDRKEAEKRIEQLSFIVKSVNDAVIMTDTERKIIYVNSAAEKMLGHTTEEMIGKQAASFFEGVPGNPPDLADHIARQARMRPWEGEILERRKDGTVFLIHLRLDVVRDEKESVIGYVGFSRNITEHRRAEEALRESETKFRAIFDSAIDGVLLADAESKKIYAGNRSICRMLGYGPEEIKKLGVTDIHPPGELPHVLELFEKQAGGEFSLARDIPVKRKDGSVFYADINSSPVTFGGKTYLLGIFRDITGRKEADKALRESEERYRSLVNNIGVGIVLISPRMEILSINPQMEKWFPHIDVSGKPLCYVSFNDPPRDDVCAYCPARKTLKDGQVHEAITETPAGDEIRNYRIISSPIKDMDGKVIAAIEMVEDITESKKAEEELRKFKTISDSANYGTAITDLEGNLLYVNDAFARMHGFTPGELINRNLAVLHTDEQMRDVRKLNKLLKEEGSFAATEVWHKRKDGTVFPSLMNATVICDEKGSPLFLSATAIDITELKITEEALRQRTFELGERVKELECLYGISDLVGAEDIPLEETLQETVDLIPPAMQYPEIACARIAFNGREFGTEGFRETAWKMSSDITVHGKRAGALEVCYLAERPESDVGPFLREEINLLDAVAERLGKTIEHRGAQEALRESTAKLAELAAEQRMLLEHTRDFLYRHDTRGVFTYISPSVEQITGYPVEDWKVHYTTYMTDNPINEKVIEYTEETLRTGSESPPYMVEIRHRDGRRILLEVNELPYLEEGKVAGIIGVARDITGRYQAEQELLKSRERLKAIIDTVPGVVYTARPDEDITTTFISANIARMIGYSPQEFADDPALWSKLVHPEDRERSRAAIEEHRRKKAPLELEYRMVHRNGHIVHILDRATPVLDSDGNISRIEGIMVDISERKKLQQRIIQADKLSAIGEMVSGVAHELNNPLGIISGHIQLLLSRVKDRAIRSRLNKMAAHVQRGTKIIHNLLSFARKGELQLEPSDIHATLEEALENVKGEFPDSDIRVVKRFASKIPSIKLDYYQIQIVFANIIKNAFQVLSETGGKGDIVIESSVKNGNVSVRIGDTGPGVEQADLKKLFDPFFTTKKVGDGTGLGLSIAYGIVKEHGGTIQAANADGGGLEVTVELPPGDTGPTADD